MANLERTFSECCGALVVTHYVEGWSACGHCGRDRTASEVVELRRQLAVAVQDLEALRAVLSDCSAFPTPGARAQRAREMTQALLDRLGGQS